MTTGTRRTAGNFPRTATYTVANTLRLGKDKDDESSLNESGGACYHHQAFRTILTAEEATNSTSPAPMLFF